MTTIRFKRGLAATWVSVNPVLADGEPGIERDTERLKIGDGVTPWNSLAYTNLGLEVTTVDDLGPGSVVLPTDALANVGSKRTLGPGAHQAAPGNDPRLSDERMPLAHHASHEVGGTDPLTSYALSSRMGSRSWSGGRKPGLMGASVTAGAGSSNASIKSYAAKLANYAGSQFVRSFSNQINGGVGGETSTQIAARIGTVIAQGPDCIIVGPDFRTNGADTISLTQVQTDLGVILAACQQAGIPMVVCTNIPRASSASAAIHLGIRTYNLWLHLWARRAQFNSGGSGVILVDTHAAVVDPTTGYLSATYDSDGTHPDDAGHDAIAAALYPALIALQTGASVPLPWPVRSPLPNFGLVTNPLVPDTTGWAAIAGVPTSATATAPVDGDGLPAGNWYALRYNNTAGGSSVSVTRGVTLGSGWAVGDTLLVCYYSKESVAGAANKVQIFDQANDVKGIPRQSSALTTGVGDITSYVVGAGVTTLKLVNTLTAVAGQDLTTSLGAFDVFNLTTLGLTAYV